MISSSELYPTNRLSSSGTPGSLSDQQVPISGSIGTSPRPKTWANVAGQPPKGSAAVLQSSTGWPIKRIPGHVFEASATRQPTNSIYPTNKTAPSNSKHTGYSNKPNTEHSNAFCSVSEANSDKNTNPSINGGLSKTNVFSTEELRELEALHQKLAKVINPTNFDQHIEKARFFVIKSFSEDDIHRSIKYSIWCSTELGNKKLDTAFAEANNQYPIYLFFSVNGSGHFCGMAEMTSRVDYNARANVWAQDKWQGKFSVRWIFVKDVPNIALRHIRIETNENKPVTHSRDTTELPLERGRQVIEVFANYSHTLSIFDDFLFYEQRERQEVSYLVILFVVLKKLKLWSF